MKKNEWQFYRIKDPAELQTVWRWEIERAAGSGAKPWLSLSQSRRRTIREYVEADLPPVRAMQLVMMTEEADALRDNLPLALHGFEIDWSRGKEAIASWFKRWVESKPHFKAHRKWPLWTPRGGRKNQFIPWLVDLAIFRASEAGIPVAEAPARLQPLIDWSFTKKKFTQRGWNKAKKNTEARIAQARQHGCFLTEHCTNLPRSAACLLKDPSLP
jgi:hypothetical protein